MSDREALSLMAYGSRKPDRNGEHITPVTSRARALRWNEKGAAQFAPLGRFSHGEGFCLRRGLLAQFTLVEQDA